MEQNLLSAIFVFLFWCWVCFRVGQIIGCLIVDTYLVRNYPCIGLGTVTKKGQQERVAVFNVKRGLVYRSSLIAMKKAMKVQEEKLSRHSCESMTSKEGE